LDDTTLDAGEDERQREAARERRKESEMKTVGMVQLVAILGICAGITWALGRLAFSAFTDGLPYIGIPCGLGAILFSCIIIKATGAVFGE